MSAKDRAELLKLKEKNKQSPNSESKKVEELKPKTFKDKRANFFYHYKTHIIFGVVAVLFLSLFIADIVSKVEYDLNILIVTKDYMIDDTLKKVEDYFKAITNDVNGDGKINISIESIYINPDDEANAQGNMASQMKLMAELSAGNTHLYLLDEDTYNRVFQDQEVFIKVDGDDKVNLKDTKLGNLLYKNSNYYLAVRENLNFNEDDLSKSKKKGKLVYEESIRVLNEVLNIK